MARYNRRDYFAHWVRKDQTANRPCTHACCRGYRPHPEGYPDTMPRRTLRGASDDQLAAHYNKCQGEACRDQVLDELNRRDRRSERHEAAEERRRTRYSRRGSERIAETDRIYRQAEEQTRGNMLNRRGREAGIDERSLFRGPESRVRRYGSEELLNFFEENPRPTEAYYRGEDTRLGRTGIRSRVSPSEERERQYYEDLEERERLDERIRVQEQEERAAAARAAARPPEYRTRIAEDMQGWVVTRDGQELPGRYDTPRAAQGAMRRAQNEGTRPARAQMTRSDFDVGADLVLFDTQAQAQNLRPRAPDRFGTPDIFGT